ncbi:MULTISPECIES: hypothetical protein [Arthrobacter]|uniref:hypothetical protein n=1 Tax=Arthrobacter TaxID=1663 RepID=UPI001474C3D4|nr:MULTISPECIES: hypothetical protein [Arthrobacter]NYG17950.1 hypothetical protein [Arthrobacter psychrochitiniphilus]
MVQIIAVLLIIWLVLAVLGFVVKGLLWLAIIGVVLFVVTAAVGWVRRNALNK